VGRKSYRNSENCQIPLQFLINNTTLMLKNTILFWKEDDTLLALKKEPQETPKTEEEALNTQWKLEKNLKLI
jgi:hypothetical protein